MPPASGKQPVVRLSPHLQLIDANAGAREAAGASGWLWVPSRYVQSLLQPYTNKPVRVIPRVVPQPSNPEALLSHAGHRRIL